MWSVRKRLVFFSAKIGPGLEGVLEVGETMRGPIDSKINRGKKRDETFDGTS